MQPQLQLQLQQLLISSCMLYCFLLTKTCFLSAPLITSHHIPLLVAALASLQAMGPRPLTLANVKMDVEDVSEGAKPEANQSFLRKYVSCAWGVGG